jgi:hypothetical protein
MTCDFPLPFELLQKTSSLDKARWQPGLPALNPCSLISSKWCWLACSVGFLQIQGCSFA